MSRPRRALGPELPGRIAATQLRVLAAEMSDPGRLARGKGYWADGAVVDIAIDPGVVTATVQGSRRHPYEVTLGTDIGPGMPTRRELEVSCTCPDDEGTGQHACKHVVAALFQFSEEVSIDPDLIGHWRQHHRVVNQAQRPDTERPAVPRPPAPPPAPPARPAHLVAFDALLVPPVGSQLPEVPALGQLLHPSTGSSVIDDMLADAMSCCTIWWG
jgi:hypothetical protein